VTRSITLAALVAAAALGALAGCGGKPGGDRAARGGAPPELVVLGIDGFDWRLVDPLLDAGRMPILRGLLDRGVRSDLLTLVPLEKSPVIWTTIATGRLPRDEERGRGFLASSGETPQAFTSWHRRSRAFWNILSERDRSVSVIGWLETWPAEEVRGQIVSDYVQYDMAEREKLRRSSRRTFPASLEQEIAPLVVAPRSIALHDLEPLLGGTFDTTAASTGLRDALDDLRWIYAGDLTFTAIGCSLLEKHPTDVMAIYLRGPDAVCHKLWEDRQHFGNGTGDSVRVRILGPTIDLYLEETDRLLGRILEKIDLSRTSLLLVSDHGFQGPRTGLDGSPMLGIYMHREIGTLVLAGPAAAGRGIVAPGARVQDVVPTMLHILGLPVAKDLDGQVHLAALGERGGAERPIELVDTYETSELPRLAEGEVDSTASEEIAERVRSLGYVR
jgi:hypothetical protein